MIAIVLAAILWVVFGYQRETIRRDFVVPIEYLNTPVEWVLEEPKVTEVKVMLMGPAQAFQLLHPERLKISVDLAQLRPGTQEITLTQDMVKAPSNLSVASIITGTDQDHHVPTPPVDRPYRGPDGKQPAPGDVGPRASRPPPPRRRSSSPAGSAARGSGS